MANSDHNKAAELHENAAKSHRAAADQHGKGDHAKGMEHSKSAQQHSQSAAKQSDQAHAMLSATAVKPPQLDEFFSIAEAPLRAVEFDSLGWTEATVWGP